MSAATVLTREEVGRQLAVWFAMGLPRGEAKVFDNRRPTEGDPHLVQLKVESALALAVWAVALGQAIVQGHGSLIVDMCEPRALLGWGIEVWCEAPMVRPGQRIAVRGDR